MSNVLVKEKEKSTEKKETKLKFGYINTACKSKEEIKPDCKNIFITDSKSIYSNKRKERRSSKVGLEGHDPGSSGGNHIQENKP